MEEKRNKFSRNSRAHLLLGILLVLLGVAILAEIVDAVPWSMRNIIFSWQMILIVLGVIFIAGKDGKSTGYILLAIGIFFILPKFFAVPSYWRGLFWPSILIVIGLLVIFNRGNRPKRWNRERSTDEDMLDEVDIFGGSRRIVRSENFKGGSITNIFGGSELDLRDCKLAEGVNELDVTMIFGGSKFIFPEEWDVKVETTSVFGGFSDKRRRSIIVPDPNRKLIIKGVTLFGGGEINNI